jgi:hypothetical protein
MKLDGASTFLLWKVCPVRDNFKRIESHTLVLGPDLFGFQRAAHGVSTKTVRSSPTDS